MDIHLYSADYNDGVVPFELCAASIQSPPASGNSSQLGGLGGDGKIRVPIKQPIKRNNNRNWVVVTQALNVP